MNPPGIDETCDHEPMDECPNCGGLGVVAGCFEDCCSGADCDPEDAETCCSPSRCDWCRGKGGTTSNQVADGFLPDGSWKP